jgi:FkbH-like protein
MANYYSSLSWLPKANQGIHHEIRKASTSSDFIKCSKYSLDYDQSLMLLERCKEIISGTPEAMSDMTSASLAIVSNSNTSFAPPLFFATSLRYGINLDVIETPFNSIATIFEAPENVFSGFNCDYVLLAIDHRGLPFADHINDLNAATLNVKFSIEYLISLASKIHSMTGAKIILQNLYLPIGGIFGSFEGRLPGTLDWFVARFNEAIDKINLDFISIIDINGLASKIGTENWESERLWNVAKIGFELSYMPIYAEYVCRVIATKLGKSKRCLIMDLDNTLWGGIIGDDGVEGILIGGGSPEGEAFSSVQKAALDLKNRGVVLAVCSKNNEDAAKAPFGAHPDMLLTLNDIAIFKANWNDKAYNIREIAKQLALGLESLVFLDDNPAERMQVRNELPEVSVPELTDDPSDFVKILLSAGYFESVTFSSEDKNRAKFYADNIKRVKASESQSDLSQHLISLEMVATFSPFDEIGRVRIAQLISKSNQFNLTTKRYSEDKLKKFEDNDNFITIQARLSDIFGDNGMVSVVICKVVEDVIFIDTWLMSCRVLGRKLEVAILEEIINIAKKRKINKLIGEYIPTAKNSMVEMHYKKLGFSKNNDQITRHIWMLDVLAYKNQKIPISIKSNL